MLILLLIVFKVDFTLRQRLTYASILFFMVTMHRGLDRIFHLDAQNFLKRIVSILEQEFEEFIGTERLFTLIQKELSSRSEFERSNKLNSWLDLAWKM